MLSSKTNLKPKMVAQDEFRAFYDSHLKPNLLALEDQRKGIVRKFTLIVIGTVMIALLFMAVVAGIMDMLLIDEEDQKLFFFIATFGTIIGIVVMLIYIAFVYRKMVAPYKNHFKKKIISPIVTLIDDNLVYDPEKKISFNEFRASQLFKSKGVDVFHGEDYVAGKLSKTAVKFSEVHAQEEDYYYDAEEGSYQYYTTVFEGLFFVFNFHLNFQGVTLILPDFGERYSGKFGKWLQSWKAKATDRQLVEFANPAFEKEFVVYSNNPAMARYVLSNHFLSRLLLFHNRLKKPVYLSFIDGKLYMAITVHKDLFEPPVFSTVLNFQLVQEFFEYLQLGREIVEDLSTFLNQPSPYLPVVNFPLQNNHNFEL